MSRVGKQPIPIPDKVKVSSEGNLVTVEGPLGRLDLTLVSGITAEVDAARKQIIVRRASEDKTHRMLHGLERTLVNNMVLGVTKGYRKDLEIHGVGYSARLEGASLQLELGFANVVKLDVPKGIKVEVAQPTNPARLAVSGCDKQQVGQFAAHIRHIRPPEPYQGKGVRYVNEVIRRKAGKAFVGAGA